MLTHVSRMQSQEIGFCALWCTPTTEEIDRRLRNITLHNILHMLQLENSLAISHLASSR